MEKEFYGTSFYGAMSLKSVWSVVRDDLIRRSMGSRQQLARLVKAAERGDLICFCLSQSKRSFSIIATKFFIEQCFQFLHTLANTYYLSF